MSRLVLFCLSAGLLAACAFSPTQPAPLSSFDATLRGTTLEGPIERDYSGTGTFMTAPNRRRPAAPTLFLITSQGNAEARDEGFQLSREGQALPSPGTYRLGSGDVEFEMIYLQRRGATTYRYAAQSGQLHFTEVSAERIAGTFSFEGAFSGTCSSSGSATSCSLSPPTADAPMLVVSGRFEAVPRQ